MSQWQYLAHVEPILPTARTGVPPDVPPAMALGPRRAPALTLAVLSTTLLAFTAPTARASAQVSWYPDCPAAKTPPAARAATYASGGEWLKLPTVVAPLPGWIGLFETPPPGLPRLRTILTGGEHVRVPPAVVHPLRWTIDLALPPPGLPRLRTILTGAEAPTRVIPRPIGPPLSWYQALANPLRLPVWLRVPAETRVEVVVIEADPIALTELVGTDGSRRILTGTAVTETPLRGTVT